MKKPCNNCKNAITYKHPNGQILHYKSYSSNFCVNCDKFKNYTEYLESLRKYEQGGVVKSIEEYLSLKAKGVKWFYWRGVIRHYKCLESMQFKTLSDAIRLGVVRIAIKKQ